MLNDKAHAIHRLIVDFVAERGYTPTIRELGNAAGLHSTNGVRYYLDRLETAGYIQRDKKRARGIILLEQPSAEGKVTALPKRAPAGEPRGIPILGRVAAGLPLLAEENLDGRMTLDEMFPANDELFALRIDGHSMKDRGILHDDVVVVRPQEHARDGDAVVALIGDDATVKTYRRTADAVELVPENPEFKTLRVGPHDDFRILGVVVGLVRPAGIQRRI
jgi:repressor LexA